VRGVETSGVARVATGLTIEAGAAWNHSELVKQATFLWRDGTPIDFSALQTSRGEKVSNPNGALVPRSPRRPCSSNIRARYEFTLTTMRRSLRSARCISLTLWLRPTIFHMTAGQIHAYDLPPYNV